MKKFYSVLSLSFLIILLLVGCQKSSSGWVEYSKGKKGDVLFYNEDSIKKTSNDKHQVWLKKIYSVEGRNEEIQDRNKRGLSTEGYE